MRELLAQQLTDAATVPFPRLTRRDARLPQIPRKAVAVIGVRRGGKTSFLYQCLADRLQQGTPRSGLLLLGFEDDRLAGITTGELDWLMEEFFRRYPEHRANPQTTICFDEIQVVPNWEQFIRRLIDTEPLNILLSGSSAKLLSREVATSMRGRSVELLIHPFSFSETLRHGGGSVEHAWNTVSSAQRSIYDHQLRKYLNHGGFPEAQGLEPQDRATLLRSYVDIAVLRDVVERHTISNVVALRWMQRSLLANPAGLFSIQKAHDSLRSQGIPVSKDTLHAYLSYLEDAFLLRTIALHTPSARQRMVNLRKSYPIDPSLIALYERSGRSNVGHALETVVFLELERRGYEASYVKTEEGWEVDFYATAPGKQSLLIQVCFEAEATETFQRETRALISASAQYSDALPLLITANSTPIRSELPTPLRWMSAAEWLLTGAA